MIKILSALVCCGIANWFVCEKIAGYEKYFCMLLVALVCLMLIIIHRRRTKNWCDNEHKDYDEDHYMVFVPSTLASLMIVLIGLLSGASGDFFAGILTFLIPCGIMGAREIEYNW